MNLRNAEFRLAAATVLGVVPLLQGVFWVGLMFGRVRYAIFYRVKPEVAG